MAIKIKYLQASSVEGICKILGESENGLSSSVISQYLRELRIDDVDTYNAKWKKLYHALINNQNITQSSNAILNFIKHAMKPARYVNDISLFEYRRYELNKILAFEGYQISEKGGLVKIENAMTIPEARTKANNLRTKLELRNTHSTVFLYCKEELLSENYFHSVLEAVKSVFDRIREISNLKNDGVILIDSAFGGESPLLIINNFISESEKSEHKGFLNLLKGLYGMFRNPTAHEVKIKWEIIEEDALDIMSIVSYCHKRLDKTHRIRL